MKKFLSLVLALVMTMSLVTVSAGAKDFGDSADLSGEAYEEAVNVMSEMGIIDGYSDGDFRPQGTLTRQAAAKIIACMMLGKTTAESLGTSAAPFKDVPAGSSFAGYIAFCVERGLISGYADGTFRPTGTLTGFAFLKMLLGAQGYDQSIEGYTGTNWTVNVAGRAYEIGLTAGNDEFVGSKACTREEAALYAVNTLQATLVEYKDKGSSITINGAEIVTGASEPTYGTSSIYNQATSINDDKDNASGDYTVEFAERYQTDLRLDGETDDFGRPARIWSWKNREIGTYVDYSTMLAEYTTKVTGDELYNLLTRNTVIKYDVDVVIDGEYKAPTGAHASDWFTKNAINRNNDAGVGGTGNGVLTQVFVDNDEEVVTIAIINTYLAIANKDYDSRRDEVSFDVYGAGKTGTTYYKDISDVFLTMKVSGEDFAIEDIAEGDKFLVNIADGEIQILNASESISNTEIQSFETSDNQNLGGMVSMVEVDGTEYDFADAASYDLEVMEYYTGDGHTNLKDMTYNVYLDAYGYVIGIEVVEKADNYMFITGIDLNGSNRGARTADATAIFLDGTIDGDAKIDYADSDFTGVAMTTDGNAMVNRWFTYTEDKNGVYTVEIVNSTTAPTKKGEIAQHQDTYDPNDGEINDKHIYLNGGLKGFTNVYGTDDTVYLTVELDELDVNGSHYGIISDVSSVATGISNVDLTIWSTAKALADADANDTTASILGTGNDWANGAYVLYNWEGDIIAAVVVGEDAGATKNLVYAHTGASYRERYNSETGEYTWNRYVVSDGQEISLTEIGDGLSKLDTMEEGNWYQVKYNADGNVIDVVKVTGTAPTGALTNGKDFEDNFTDLATTIQTGEDTVLYWGTNPEINSDNLKLIGRTLYLDTTSTRGFRVAEDVNIVLEQQNNNTSKTYFETGVNALEAIVNELNERHSTKATKHDYIVSAVIENGVATSVIIDDDNRVCDPYADPDWGTTTGDYEITNIRYPASNLIEIDIDNEIVAGCGLDAKVYISAGGSYSQFGGTAVLNNGWKTIQISDSTLASGQYSVKAELYQNGVLVDEATRFISVS